ncbi:hypothetical protein Tco_1491582 [Tanacetum coccineum]
MTTTTPPVTNAQLKALIDQGVADALAARDADRSMNGNDSHNSGTGVRRNKRVVQTVFSISNCSVENQIMVFPLVLLLGKSALTWWNSHVRTVGHDVAYAMTWTDLKKKMTDKLKHRNTKNVVRRWIRKDKLRRNFEIEWKLKMLAKVGAVAYRLELLRELSRVQNTFHVSNLKKCYSDEPLVVLLDGLHIDDKLHFIEEPVKT